MNRKITVLTLCAILFALCPFAEAQQPKKVPSDRLSFCSSTQLVSPPVPSAIRAGAARVAAISKDRTSPSTTDMRRGKPRSGA